MNGTPIDINSLAETSKPSLRRIPPAAMFADAPTGVILPPSVAPANRPKYSTVGKFNFPNSVKWGRVWVRILW